MITSIANEKVKYVCSLYRRRVRYRERRFVIEGVRLVDEAVRAGIVPALVFYQGSKEQGARELATLLPCDLAPLIAGIQTGRISTFAVSEGVMKAMAGTVSPQGILAVVPFVELAPPPSSSLVLVIDRLRDPGNLGTILRSANAAGVEQVILAPQTVDHYNPKVVRGAMGAHFRLPIVALSWPDIADSSTGVQILLADVQGEQAYYEVDWTRPSALIIGGEAHGASRAARELATATIAIPMHSGAESLNAAVAASVILFEAARQRAREQGAKEQRSKEQGSLRPCSPATLLH
ncbi:MAG: RNA methyltransferase [Chloroflexi bacterium]|nr:RNA methyltransferase [Chloroflexota bacterium]